MCRTAGAVADGVVAHPMATIRYIDEVMRPAIEEGAEREGRSGADVKIADWIIAAVSDDADRAREDAKRQIAFHATVRTYDRIIDLHGFTDVAAQIRELWKKFDLAGMTALVTDEMLEAMGIAGSVQDCRDQLAARTSSADRLLLGAPVVATDPGALRAYHDALIEAFGTSATENG
jgi:alkanesulfonate monooxygenase SsuD/methylene tetrahydromethanopterin reductase-like flavin-dependent oxidoreductase (luciferase family)